MMPGDYATISLIADARFTARHVYGRRVSAPAIKATLLAVWAHDGRPVSIERLADTTGHGPHLVRFCVVSLVVDGIIIRKRRHQGPSLYAINNAALAALQPPPPRSLAG